MIVVTILALEERLTIYVNPRGIVLVGEVLLYGSDFSVSFSKFKIP